MRIPRRTLYATPTGLLALASTSITDLLLAVQQGQTGAYDALLPLVYDELRRMAAGSMQREREGHTLQPTALVHEAFLRLVDQRSANFESRRHFFAVAATLMRRILVDHARRTRADKRGYRMVVPLRDDMDAAVEETHEIIEVDEALQQLAALDARQAQVVELRYFAGLSVEETAKVLDVSERTVKRDWAVARAFLHRALDAAADR
ncbi:MAG: sigma-70 family RNA polymerase sigma factor [Gemmatimonas sp.]